MSKWILSIAHRMTTRMLSLLGTRHELFYFTCASRIIFISAWELLFCSMQADGLSAQAQWVKTHDWSECAMRREYRRSLFVCLCVLLQLLALGRMQIMSGYSDFFTLRVGRSLRDELQQKIIEHLTWTVPQIRNKYIKLVRRCGPQQYKSCCSNQHSTQIFLNLFPLKV